MNRPKLSVLTAVRLGPLAVTAALLLAACGGGGEVRPRFLGATSANVSSLTSSPGGGVISVIFDDFRLEWVPNEQARNDRTTKTQKRGLVLALPARLSGASVKVDIRGSYLRSGPAQKPVVRLIAGGRTFMVDLPDGEAVPDFYRSYSFAVPTGAESVAIHVEASATQPEEKTSNILLDIDSIDIGISKPDG